MSNREEPGDLSAAEGIAVLLALTGGTIIVFGGLLWLCVAGVMPAQARRIAGITLEKLAALAASEQQRAA